MVIALTGSEVKDLSAKERGLAAPFSRDGSHKTMHGASCSPMRKPLVGWRLPTPISPPSRCCHARAKQSGSQPSRELLQTGRKGHWVMAYSSLAWGPIHLSSSLTYSLSTYYVPPEARRSTPTGPASATLEDAEVQLFPRRRLAAGAASPWEESAFPLQAPFLFLFLFFSDQKGAAEVRDQSPRPQVPGVDMRNLGCSENLG